MIQLFLSLSFYVGIPPGMLFFLILFILFTFSWCNPTLSGRERKREMLRVCVAYPTSSSSCFFSPPDVDKPSLQFGMVVVDFVAEISAERRTWLLVIHCLLADGTNFLQFKSAEKQTNWFFDFTEIRTEDLPCPAVAL